MRIAFLCKRQYTGHDVIADRYGRLYELPLQLARMGHEVHAFCLDYGLSKAGPSQDGTWTHEAAPGSLQWTSRSLGKSKLPALLAYPSRLLRRLREFEPDLIVGASDIPQLALASWVAKQLRVPCALDVYDNFESFGQAKIPGFVPLLRRAAREADLLIAVSAALKRFIAENYRPRAPIAVMGNSLDKSVFHSREKHAARATFGLPQDAKLIGTAGNLHRLKGIAPLYEAWKIIEAQRDDVHLVLAGPVENGFPPPQGERVHYLGNLAYARVPEVFAALDVGIVSVLDSAFGRYCFPQKASEMLACGLPVVAANVGATGELFASAPEALFEAGNAQDMATTILRQLDHPQTTAQHVPDWRELVAGIEPALRALAR